MKMKTQSDKSPEITAKKGLLWRNGKVIPLPEADMIARSRGFQYAEQLVATLSQREMAGVREKSN